MYSYAIVIVTYNRLKMLKTCLEHAFGQTMKPCAVVVVDNCSTDGTSEYLDQLKRGKEYPSESMRFLLYHEKENIGGAGGFHDGLKIAVKHTDADWFLLIDDDAILDYDCMEKMDPQTSQHPASAYACSVYYKGELELSHRQDRKGNIPEKQYEQPEFLCERTSFCGSMFSRDLVEKIGYPLKEYFLWFDDTEYSLRVKRHTDIVVRTDASLQHGDPDKPDQRATVDWRYYYGTRNHLDMLRRHKMIPQYIAFDLEARLIVLLRYLRIARNRKNDEIRRQNETEALIFRAGRIDAKGGKLGKNPSFLPGTVIEGRK